MIMARANSLSVDLVRGGAAWLASAWAPEKNGGRNGQNQRHVARLFASAGVSAQVGMVILTMQYFNQY